MYCLLELWTRNKSAKPFLASTQSRQGRPKAEKCSRGWAPDCSREEILASLSTTRRSSGGAGRAFSF